MGSTESVSAFWDKADTGRTTAQCPLRPKADILYISMVIEIKLDRETYFNNH